MLADAPVLSGTRIPAVAVWDFQRAGYDAAAIIREYPRLTERDVERAIAFECERRQPQRAGYRAVDDLHARWCCSSTNAAR